MKEIILNTVEDLVSNFVYYHRKSDSNLSMEYLNSSIENKEITIAEIVAEFEKHLRNTYPDQP